MLLELFDLERSLQIPVREAFDAEFAQWCIDTVSAEALDLTGAKWAEPSDVPPAAAAILGKATRRLYVNADLISTEREGEYQVSYSTSATGTETFTEDEKARLKRIAGVYQTRRTFGTIRMSRGDSAAPHSWEGRYF